MYNMHTDKNIKHNILFIGKKTDNFINDKISLCPLKKYYVYYFMIILKNYVI
jgi:hypothetical protein